MPYKDPATRAAYRLKWERDNVEKTRQYYRDHATERRAHKKQVHAALKLEVVHEYGGRCQCSGGCDIVEPRFLTIDHVNNDGGAHRKQIGDGNILKWLKKNGFPKNGFRLLCFNCNLGRGHGPCPHEEH